MVYRLFPQKIYCFLTEHERSVNSWVVLQSGLKQTYPYLKKYKINKTRSLIFSDIKAEIVFYPQDDIEKLFKKIDYWRKKGFWLAGYFAYEFSYILNPKLTICLREKPLKIPLVWLGVFSKPDIIEASDKSLAQNYSFCKKKQQLNLFPKIEFSKYKRQCERIKRYIFEGDTYQINLTFPFENYSKNINFVDLYLKLAWQQPTAYQAAIHNPYCDIVSFSPELFFYWQESEIITRPMKGTIKRGVFLKEDKYYKQMLYTSEKDRAENLMIVDLFRNDLSSIPGQKLVKVLKLWEIEKYPNLLQMTSTIQAKFKTKLNFYQIVKALFPSGSVTGAPKIRSQQIISSIEKYPRGVYCGAIGYISNENEACFSVPIRTATIIKTKKNKKVIIPVGGAIVADSIAGKEYKEAFLKAQFALKSTNQFFIIESIFWSKTEGFRFLNLHLSRLAESARYFFFRYNKKKIERILKRYIKNINSKDAEKCQYKINLYLFWQGTVSCFGQKIQPIKNLPVKIRLEKNYRIFSKDIFRYHKTSLREGYDYYWQIAKKQGFWDVIFCNEKGEVCEGTISNIFIKRQHKLFTPPLKCGLLPGVLREHLLQRGVIEEKIIYPQDLYCADQIFIGNSVRGLIPAKLID